MALAWEISKIPPCGRTLDVSDFLSKRGGTTVLSSQAVLGEGGDNNKATHATPIPERVVHRGHLGGG